MHTGLSRTRATSTTPFAVAPALAGLGPPITATFLTKKPTNNDAKEDSIEEPQDYDQEVEFLRDEIEHIEALQEIVDELEEFAFDNFQDDNEMVWSEERLKEIFGEIPDDDDDDDNYDSDGDDEFDDDFETDDDKEVEEEFDDNYMEVRTANDFQRMEERIRLSAAADFERALLEGVVPVSAGVGNEVLPGDFGFDPFHLSDKDYFRQAQGFLLNLVPSRGNTDGTTSTGTATKEESSKLARPKALILRDLREAETRHGRLAMLAAVFWPLQEMLDRIVLDPEQCGPILYGPVTLPYFPLLMTGIMLLLGYVDIYAKEVKQQESIGEAFLPGDCFYDPSRILQDAPDSMKRNMQERELLNGRVAMLAFAVFVWEEAITHLPLIEIGQNDLLLEPAYEVPFIQQWLDAQFSYTDLM